MADLGPVPSRRNRGIRITISALACVALGLTGCARSSGTASSCSSAASVGASASSATASATSPKPSPSSTTPAPFAAVGKYGVGDAVTHPTCPVPPSQHRTFKAPGKVVPDLPELSRGTDHGAAADKWVYPASSVQKWVTTPTTAPKNKKIAFITFDDGPTASMTPRELTNLEQARVPATFFMITPQLQDVQTSLLRRSLRDGNALAIHSYSHDYHYLFHGSASDKATHVSCDDDWAVAQARDVLGAGYYASGFRYPGGHMSWHNLRPADAALGRRGASWIDWNAESGDAEANPPRTPSGMVAYLKKTMAEEGNPRVLVILNHDAADKRLTAESMPSLIRYLKAQGYSFGVMN